MDDVRIVELLFERTDTALEEISNKYSRLYKGIIRGVLGDECDVEECANDLLLAVWNTIPPNKPDQVLFGLIFGASLGPFKFDPTINPPISIAQTIMQNHNVL